jgi:ABC-type transporter MlaC component
MFGSILATAINVLAAIAAVVKYIVTLGGVLTENGQSYTGEHIEKSIKDIKDIESNKKMSPKEDRQLIDEAEQPTMAETARGLRLMSNSMLRKQMHRNEVALKSIYVDWVFDKLNLSKYR